MKNRAGPPAAQGKFRLPFCLRAAAGRQGWPQATRGGRRPPWREQRDPGGAVIGFKVPLVT